MTRDDIIRMARDAGMPRLSLIDVGYLQNFANLVAAAEREACAQSAEEWACSLDDDRPVATAIRARGEK